MYTKIPNTLFDKLPLLSGTQTKVILAIYRATAGWQRDTASLSLSTLHKMTGASTRQISDALSYLESQGMIERMYCATGFVYRIIDVVDDTVVEETAIEQTSMEEIAIEKTSTKVLKKSLPNKERKESNTTVSNDTVRKRKPRAKQQSTERTALTVFRHFHRLHVPIALREQVETVVTDLDAWETVCKEWIARGYKPGNVSGCLQVYQNGWKDHDTRRVQRKQRGDAQRQQREEKLGQYLAEYQL